MGTNTVQLTPEQAAALNRVLATVPTIALWPGEVVRTTTRPASLDVDALVKTFASIAQCLTRELRAHEATATELRTLRQAQHIIQTFLCTVPDKPAPDPAQS
ncbi:hypothetical protein [Mycobacteroides abscessus]|uniref:hypothetical protein n=1 Tax=Mycobacteroides abscessus TaxID=36809 RepID=UPI000928B152|nr:hypothetical protein [Mycobacteroides abscessus]SIC19629.1 Uncharacterised protein [Mycobacteroides abscessus subsp. abscessus]